jgi:hypothetical protein
VEDDDYIEKRSQRKRAADILYFPSAVVVSNKLGNKLKEKTRRRATSEGAVERT